MNVYKPSDKLVFNIIININILYIIIFNGKLVLVYTLMIMINLIMLIN